MQLIVTIKGFLLQIYNCSAKLTPKHPFLQLASKLIGYTIWPQNHPLPILRNVCGIMQVIEAFLYICHAVGIYEAWNTSHNDCRIIRMLRFWSPVGIIIRRMMNKVKLTLWTNSFRLFWIDKPTVSTHTVEPFISNWKIHMILSINISSIMFTDHLLIFFTQDVTSVKPKIFQSFFFQHVYFIKFFSKW